jgi:hypothetical protein
MIRMTKSVRGALTLIGMALALVAVIGTEARAQVGYEDAWTDEVEHASEEPDGYYWGYSSTTCDGSCSDDPIVINVATNATGLALDTGSNVFASNSSNGGQHSSTTVFAGVPASMPDGDYAFRGEHTVTRRMESGGFQWDDVAFFTGVIASIRFSGLQNRYVFDRFESPNRWVFRNDECNALCQTSEQYINYDPGDTNVNKYLHRSVRRIAVFGFGKCHKAVLTLRTTRGNCTAQ